MLHRLAASNIVVGETEFLRLPLPLPWQLTRAVVTPEVGTTTRQGSIVWVASGETRHVVFDRAANRGLDLAVRVSYGVPRLPQRARMVLEEGAAVCDGHDARFRIVRRGRGFLLRGEEHALFVAFTCPVTSRGILLELSGVCTVDELREFLTAWAELECH